MKKDQTFYPTQYLNKHSGNVESTGGITVREAFAMAAMQGLLSNAQFVQAMGHYNMDHKQIVTVSIGVADELLKQLES